MKFANVYFLNLLWFLAALVVFHIYIFRRYKILLSQWGDLPLVNKLVSKVSFGKRKIKAIVLLVAFLFIVIALAQPQWGYHWEEMKRKGIDIIIVLDTSKSMLADDVKPNRLSAAKFEIEDLLKVIEGDRIGLVAFAGTSFLQCPLTLDYSALRLFLDSIDPDILPQQGTDIGSAVRKALKTFSGDSKKHRAILLISDGEDHNNSLLNAAEEAKKEGVPIFAAGVGTSEGAPIPVVGESGGRAYLKDKNNNTVLSKLDSNTLKKAALTTGGAYIDAGAGGVGLDKLYTESLSKIEKKELASATRRIYENRFQWPLVIAFILLMIEGLISERKSK